IGQRVCRRALVFFGMTQRKTCGFQMQGPRRVFLPLLGERAGKRASVTSSASNEHENHHDSKLVGLLGWLSCVAFRQRRSNEEVCYGGRWSNHNQSNRA